MNALAIMLADGIEALGIGLSSAQIAQLEGYLDLLEKWNRVYNLTAIRERAQMVTHHVLDSLAVLPHLRGPRVLDVGSGGGLPGIPVAIARPDLDVTLLDANHKKSAFLNQAAAELRLANVHVAAQRVESWETAQRFDTIVSRAFADLGEFATVAGRLLAEGGCLAAMKGVHPFEEIERLPQGYVVREVIRLQVPGLDAERHLVMIGRV
jgi:16S rRNA (guanine527-N7)-methyltransferase